MDAKKQIRTGAIISYAGIILSVAISLLYTPWMVSIIGKAHYGLYVLISSFISLFMVDFGLNAATTRFIAKYRAESSQDKINEFVVTVEKLYLIIDVVIALLLFVAYFCIDNIYTGLTQDELKTLRGLYIIAVLYSIISFPCLPFTGILNAYEKFIQAKLCDIFYKLASTSLIIIALVMGAGVNAIVSAHAAAGIITILIKIYLIKTSTPVEFKSTKLNIILLKDIACFSIWVTVIVIAQRCTFNIAPTVLGIVSSSSEIAVFAPANALEGYYFTIGGVVSGLFIPMISRYAAANEEKKIFNIMVTVGRYQILLLGLILTCFTSAGGDFMLSWMSEDFIKSWPCAIMLFVADLLLFSIHIGDVTLMVKNKVRTLAMGYACMAVVCLLLSLFLCGTLGAIGVSIAILVAYAIQFVYNLVVFRLHLNVNVVSLLMKCYGNTFIPLLISVAAGYTICNLLMQIHGWPGVLVKSFVALGIYVAIMSKSLTAEEKNMIARGLESCMQRLKSCF